MRITYPLAMHTLAAVELALTVVDDKPWVAAGIASIAFEHALAAQWVLLTDGGEHDIVEWMQYEADKRSQSFYEGLGKPEEYKSLAATTGPKPPYNVYNACTRFTAHQAGKLFYDIYRNLSEGAHPSIGSLTGYLDFDPAELVVRHREPTGTLTRAGHTATGLACAALWALDAVEELHRTTTRLAHLRDIGDAAELPFSLRAPDTKPHLQPPARPSASS